VRYVRYVWLHLTPGLSFEANCLLSGRGGDGSNGATTVPSGSLAPVLSASPASPCGREVPKDKHLCGKVSTQRIERNNLTLRTRIKRLARKMICLRSTKKSSERLSENTCSTNWRHHHLLNQSPVQKFIGENTSIDLLMDI
jgi:hypothetical protein